MCACVCVQRGEREEIHILRCKYKIQRAMHQEFPSKFTF